MLASEMLEREFGTLADLIAAHAREAGDRSALIQDGRTLTYAALDALMDRIAAALQRDGLAPGEAVAICAATSLNYAAVFLGALRAGAVPAPLPPSSTPDALAAMIQDCGARLIFLDREAGDALGPRAAPGAPRRLALDGSGAGQPLEAWLAPADARPAPVEVRPEDGFNLIYSSGTTGVPKGIVQPHSMRWPQIHRAGYHQASVTLVSTPLYSNTTLVSFLAALGKGGTVVMMDRFDAKVFLELSQAHRVTVAMLVPVQYRRLMQQPDFDAYDLSSYQMKFCSSAPFAAELKRDIVARWPGGLIELYGMTEGGGACALAAHEHPDKLHTVGRPLPGHDLRVIDEAGRELPPGEMGEIVGRSSSMMSGYHNLPAKTREIHWRSSDGHLFHRTGDVGRFDPDGFLILMDRKKDMIISGGFNIYPSDLEAELARHPDVAEAAVVGVASERWGETPVAFVAPRPGRRPDPGALKAWANARLGKMQRLADLQVMDALPRSSIGKVLKRDLRDGYRGLPADA
jgi:acyl-CoA synthetase (AMP-forming)/AMP-acid ligase II